MYHYTAYTLVDITESLVTKSENINTVWYNQQQNLNTLLQCISLRSQPIEPKISVSMTQDIANYGFGKQYQGLHTVWRLDFSSEHGEVYSKNNNPVHNLIEDCNGVAVITKLEETCEIKTKSFETRNPNLINLYFKLNPDIR